MAQSVFQHLANQAGRAEEFIIDSAGTSNEEEGNPPHPGTQQKLAEKHVPLVPHASRPIQAHEFKKWDLIIYMDEQNEASLQRIFKTANPHPKHAAAYAEKLKPLLAFAPHAYTKGRLSVADPWWTHDFQKTYEDVCAGCEGLLKTL